MKRIDAMIFKIITICAFVIQKYELLNPDLIITDISMPRLSGTGALKELKSKYPDIKVLFIFCENTMNNRVIVTFR
jgi:DNA-binding NarL/FixJ family response regulator